MRLKSRYDIDAVARSLGVEVNEAYLLMDKYRVVPSDRGLYPSQAVEEVKIIRSREEKDGEGKGI